MAILPTTKPIHNNWSENGRMKPMTAATISLIFTAVLLFPGKLIYSQWYVLASLPLAIFFGMIYGSTAHTEEPTRQ